MEKVAFYTVADARYFVGAVALVNSLRLVGHQEPIFVADCGLTDEQRRLLARETCVIEGARETPPLLGKCVGPLTHAAEIQALVDADIIVTGSLQPLLARAAAGEVVAVEDQQARFHPGWAEALGVPTLPRRRYLNGGLLLLPHALREPLLTEVAKVLRDLDVSRSRLGKATVADPFFYPDQDTWNSVLAARVAAEKVVVQERRLAPFPPFAGIRITDRAALECRYPDGVSPYVLHRIGPKPWLQRTHEDAYSILLQRLLFEPDLPIRIDPGMLPLRLRGTPFARVDQTVSNAVDVWRWRLGRLRSRRERRRLLRGA